MTASTPTRFTGVLLRRADRKRSRLRCSGDAAGARLGIRIDVDSTGARIFNNSIYNVLTGLYLIHPATVEYNAVSDAKHAVVDAKEGGDFAHNVWGRFSVFFVNGSDHGVEMPGWRVGRSHAGRAGGD